MRPLPAPPRRTPEPAQRQGFEPDGFGTVPGWRRRLVLMVKEPKAGRVKTRLARQAGVGPALRFYRHNMAATIARLARDPRWETYLAVAPDNAVTSPMWPGDIWCIPQGSGDLGQRMQRVMDALPPGPVVIIGTDVPAIAARHVAAAFRSLGPADAVLGPAPDGGYWLVGLKRFPKVPRAFADVRWSSADALADTARNLARLRLAKLETLLDVDEAGDLAAAGGARRLVRA